MLTKTHPLAIWLLYVSIILFMLVFASISLEFGLGCMVAIFIAGMFSWTLFEYLMHRFAFHFVADSPRARRIIYVMHSNHHEYPRDKERLFMPPVPSLIIASIVFYLVKLAI